MSKIPIPKFEWTEEDAERLIEKSWDDVERRQAPLAIVKGKFDAFVSPVDNSVITSQRQLDQHNKRNNVVDSREFSQAYYDRKAAERAKLFDPESGHDSKQRKKDIVDAIQIEISKTVGS